MGVDASGVGRRDAARAAPQGPVAAVVRASGLGRDTFAAVTGASLASLPAARGEALAAGATGPLASCSRTGEGPLRGPPPTEAPLPWLSSAGGGPTSGGDGVSLAVAAPERSRSCRLPPPDAKPRWASAAAAASAERALPGTALRV